LNASYQATEEKLRLAALPVLMGDCQPVHLWMDPVMHLLAFEVLQRVLSEIAIDAQGGSAP